MTRVWTSVAIALLAAMPAFAGDLRTETVHFPARQSGTTISDSIKGYQSVAYELGAAQGQTMVVDFATSNPSAYFNVYAPGKGPGDAAMYVGAASGNRFEGTLPAAGDYTVSVYLYRSAARRDEVADYTLDIGIDR
ncbi:hypothetical protein CLV78_10653 [Aliiruegeria haliotis]|uniref:DNA breaking-rejoining protein n=1 Tax=Aliiruegeria haliotis TaxID=1280846 RepID=A0A2T0RN27_9RHOB|nr:DNA breaking-rejoining protein [Aliiruegeria haliotis]PRY22513.1 hypothetical protein CLV78_10653 [Aliiruegeria haliotis]